MDKIKKEHYSPDAVIGRLRAEDKKFDTEICTKTLYNYIDKESFLNIRNKDLFIKSEIKNSNKCSNIFYAYIYCCMERENNENGNIMPGRFIPKGIDIGTISETRLQETED